MSTHRDPVTRRLVVPVHDGPGLAPVPSVDALASGLVRRSDIARSAD